MEERINLREKAPEWARAVIVAELMVDDSDIMTDYFAAHSERTLYLAWSRHTRDLFPELRKAAANAKETEHLGHGKDLYRPLVVIATNFKSHGAYYGDGQHSPWHCEQEPEDALTTKQEAEDWIKGKGAPKSIMNGETEVHFRWVITQDSIEHREKYAMGKGYYLSAGRGMSGWTVRKLALAAVSGEVEAKDYRIPGPSEHASESVRVGEAEIRPGTRAGYSEVVFGNKPPADVRAALKAAGYRWSRHNSCWYGRTDNLPAF